MYKRFEVEKIECVSFSINYARQNDEVKKNWSEYYFEMLNCYNSYGNWALKFEMKQGSREPNGFYPNVIEIIVEKGCCREEFKRDLLNSYGFTFNEYEGTINKIIVEDYDEYMIEYE